MLNSSCHCIHNTFDMKNDCAIGFQIQMFKMLSGECKKIHLYKIVILTLLQVSKLLNYRNNLYKNIELKFCSGISYSLLCHNLTNYYALSNHIFSDEYDYCFQNKILSGSFRNVLSSTFSCTSELFWIVL